MGSTARENDNKATLAWADYALEHARGREKLEALIRAVRAEILFETVPYGDPSTPRPLDP